MSSHPKSWSATEDAVRASWHAHLALDNYHGFPDDPTTPSFRMPAVDLGQDWGTATVGRTVKLGRSVTLLGTVSSEFAQRDTRSYGGQLGLNVAF